MPLLWSLIVTPSSRPSSTMRLVAIVERSVDSLPIFSCDTLSHAHMPQMFIGCISPDPSFLKETRAALENVSRAHTIRNYPKRNVMETKADAQRLAYL